jgi:hypothetical protein
MRGFGAGDGIRTRDIQLGKLTLYQLSYTRIWQDLAIYRAFLALLQEAWL